MKLGPKLTPFWFVPPFQSEEPPVRFELRPLTNQQMVEVEELYDHDENDASRPAKWTEAAKFRAGMLAIVRCENIADDKGEPIVWPYGIDKTQGAESEHLRVLVRQCGARIIIEMNGGDWDALIKSADEKWAAQQQRNKQPAEGDPLKT